MPKKKPSCLDCIHYTRKDGRPWCEIDGAPIEKPEQGTCPHDFEPITQA